jgi:hypothetical protein
MMMMVFWVMTPQINKNVSEKHTVSIFISPEDGKQHVSQKCWYLPMSTHSVTTWKNIFFYHRNHKSHTISAVTSTMKIVVACSSKMLVIYYKNTVS